MTDAEALDIAVKRTAHERYRDYLEPSHPDYDPRFWPIVRDLATRPWPEEPAPAPVDPSPPTIPLPVTPAVARTIDRVDVAVTLARLAEIKACRYFTRSATCGCAFGRCLDTGKPTNFYACDHCLKWSNQGL